MNTEHCHTEEDEKKKDTTTTTTTPIHITSTSSSSSNGAGSASSESLLSNPPPDDDDDDDFTNDQNRMLVLLRQALRNTNEYFRDNNNGDNEIDIDSMYSDEYLLLVLNVPGRTFEYTRDEKLIKSLQWRNEFHVNSIRKAFVATCVDNNNDDVANKNEEGGSRRGMIFVPSAPSVKESTTRTSSSDGKEEEEESEKELEDVMMKDDVLFIPSSELIEICASDAFVVQNEPDIDGRLVLLATPSKLDWWRIGVEAGLQYHVLVIEHALERIRMSATATVGAATALASAKSSSTSTSSPTLLLQESLIVKVDTSNLSYIPPPISALTGMSSLLQTAYPDRIHRIYVGPVNTVLYKLYESIVKPLLRPRSRDKIILMKESPSFH